MAKAAYQVIPVDLSIIRSAPGQPLVPTGQPYDAVNVLDLPVGAVVFLSFGENTPLVPLLSAPQSFRFTDDCGNPLPITEGLRVSNPAGGGTVQLLVSFSGTNVSN